MSVKTNNPVESTYGTPKPAPSGSTAASIPHPPPISSSTHCIAGLLVNVYGVEELQPSATDVAVLWLLHPRLQTQACMAPFAAHIIQSYNSRPSSKSKGLIAASFDQRNHGSREVSKISNEAWRQGNEKHAQDMFSSYQGTSVDTSQLMDYIAAYVFPSNERKIVQNLVMGISLGGHAAWHVLMQDSRVSAAIATIGCPDYARLMSDRARLSKRETWSEGDGRDFLGSKDFPVGLVESVRKYDPAGLIWGTLGRREGQEHLYDEVTQEEKSRIMPVMTRSFGNKRLLCLAGG